MDTYNGEPACCGHPMVVSEYDSDEDLYLYRCTVIIEHERWFENDDETWK